MRRTSVRRSLTVASDDRVMFYFGETLRPLLAQRKEGDPRGLDVRAPTKTGLAIVAVSAGRWTTPRKRTWPTWIDIACLLERRRAVRPTPDIWPRYEIWMGTRISCLKFFVRWLYENWCTKINTIRHWFVMHLHASVKTTELGEFLLVHARIAFSKTGFRVISATIRVKVLKTSYIILSETMQLQ